MVNKKPDEQSLSELIDTAKQIALLIEDNNQNIKDCSAILRQIQKKFVLLHNHYHSACV